MGYRPSPHATVGVMTTAVMLMIELHDCDHGGGKTCDSVDNCGSNSSGNVTKHSPRILNVKKTFNPQRIPSLITC